MSKGSIRKCGEDLPVSAHGRRPLKRKLMQRFNVIYPLYLDAKVSIADGRRVPRKSAMWWPQAQHIAQACRALLLPSALEVRLRVATDLLLPRTRYPL